MLPLGSGHAGGRGFLLQDSAFERGGRGGTGEGADSGQELVEDDAEAVDVGRGGGVVSADLFGRGVVGGHGASAHGGEPGAGEVGLGGRVFVGEDASDAEVEELHVAGLGDEDVRGLEIPMDDEVAVCELNGLGDLADESQAFGDLGVSCLAPRGDGLAVDELHGEPGSTVVGDAAVDEGGDVGMGESGEDASFAEEAALHLFSVESAADELEGHALLEGRVDPFGEEDRAHAPAAELVKDAPPPDLLAGEIGTQGLEDIGRGGGVLAQGGSFEKSARAPVGGENRLDLDPELRIVVATVVEKPLDLRRGQIESLIQDLVDPHPALSPDLQPRAPHSNHPAPT
ncbi:MAG: hypothetical protein R3E12_15350 [Candidatus Eisenbacteria bacterium]